MDIERIFSSAILGHQISTTYMEVSVDLGDGRKFKLYAVPTNMVDMSAPYVELLTRQCTPQNPRVDEEAKPKLEGAIMGLINKGENFYTYFRAHWTLPALEWKLKA